MEKGATMGEVAKNMYNMSPHFLSHNYYIGASIEKPATIGDNETNGGQKKPLVTPFGGAGGALTLSAIILSSQSQIIAFFTEALNSAILMEYSGAEVLGVMFIVLFLLFVSISPVREIITTQAGEGTGWRLTLAMAIDFFSRAIMLLTFGFAAQYLKIVWAHLGMTLAEILTSTISLGFFWLGAYAFYLSQFETE
jgi:hypothetical protein